MDTPTALRELPLCALCTVLCRARDRRLCRRWAYSRAVAVAWGGLAEQALLDGTVEVLWAGQMRVMKHHDMNPDSPLVCFADVVCRDPFSIVGRSPIQVSARRPRSHADRDRQRDADTLVMPSGGSAASGDRPGVARSHRRSQHGRKPLCLKRGPDRGGSVFRARRRRRLGFGQVPPMVLSKHARPYQLHRFCHDAEPARSQRRAPIAHGQGDPADPALDLYSICPRDCRGDLFVLPGARYRCADCCTRPLSVAVGMGTRSGSSRGRL